MMEGNKSKKNEKHFSKGCRGPSGDLRGGTNGSVRIRSAKKNTTCFYHFFCW